MYVDITFFPASLAFAAPRAAFTYLIRPLLLHIILLGRSSYQTPVVAGESQRKRIGYDPLQSRCILCRPNTHTTADEEILVLFRVVFELDN